MNTKYHDRLENLTDYLIQQEIEAAIVTSPADVFYYTGFDCDPHERFMGLAIDSSKREYSLFVPLLDKDIAREAAHVETIIGVSDEEDPFKVLHHELGKRIRKMGLEMKAMTIFQYYKLQEFFPACVYEDIQPFINRQRMKKSAHERRHAKEALDIIEKVLEEGINKAKIGMSELELTAELEYLMRKHGADSPAFSTIVLSGEKSALPHGTPGDRVFKKGDFLLIDFGVRKNGYCSDITRTFIIGEADEKQKEIYNIVLEANEAGLHAVKSGSPFSAVDLAARNVINGKGYGGYFNNRVGHGIGIEVHEEPSLHEHNRQTAEEGLLITIEPGIYIPGYGGVRIEDTVYINENGTGEILSSYPKSFKII